MTSMITAVHTLVYADDAEKARAFFRDVMQLPFADTGGGWLIFKTGPSELATHPNAWGEGDRAGGTDQAFDFSLMCDDLVTTMAELKERGAEFDGDVVEQRWGHTIRVKVPGAGAITVYEPTYEPPATTL